MGIAYAADVAHAFAQPPGNGGISQQVAPLFLVAAMFVIFYFLLIRPQQKQRKQRDAMLASVKRGDRVVTTSGLHGTVVGLNEHTIILKVTDQVKLEFDRSALARIGTSPGEKEEA